MSKKWISNTGALAFVTLIKTAISNARNTSEAEYKELTSQIKNIQDRLSADEQAGYVSSIILHNSTDIKDPGLKITGSIGLDKTADENIFAWIRANTHHYVSKYNETDDILEVAQLSDTDRTLYASDDSEAPITTLGNDVFGKLPTFWTKISLLLDEDGNISDDIRLSVANNANYVDDTWNKWGDATVNDTVYGKFLGTYKGFVGDTDGNAANARNSGAANTFTDGDKLYSVSGKTATNWYTVDAFASAAAARSKHHSKITYDWHCILQILFWGMYGTTNSQAKLGRGIDYYPQVTGGTNSKAMTDTTTADYNKTVVNFLGFEAIYTDLWESLGRIKSDANLNLIVSDEDGNTIATVPYTNLNAWGLITKLNIDTEGHITVASVQTSNQDWNTYYADYANAYAGAGRVPDRGDSGSSVGGGFSTFYVSAAGGKSAGDLGSRLAYYGPYKIVDKLSDDTTDSTETTTE